ncbi:EamA family transporter [Clostridium kluyveri]|uniref:EamA family transporter n=1 Tax=Clostridium kluyveri TaxID=1534 RepID=UPI0022457BCA|nr:DMT family transporter [Clostridium kluyveri]UZQ50592.1 DMT family transporter [Clostridium kluyveri]
MVNFQPRIKGILLVITGAMFWGISGTVAQYLFHQKGFTPEWLVVVRLLVSGLLLLLYISKLALFWGIASAFTAAFNTLQPRSLLARWDSSIIVGWGMLIGGLAFSLINPPWNFTGEWSIASILAVMFVVLFGTLIAFYCYLESLKYIQPTETSILSSVEPLSAAFLSVVWLHVHFGVFQWLGTLCIIVAIIILSVVKNKEVVYE